MKNIAVKELENESINKLIDENIRFSIISDEEIEEGVENKYVSDRIAILREKCNSNNV